MRTRTLIAGLTAPIIGITAAFIVLGLWASNPDDSLTRTASSITSWLGPFLLFGVPVVYLLEAALGIPLYRWMLRRNAVTIVPVLLTATATGLLALFLPLIFLGGEWSLETLSLSLLGAVGGLVTAVWFWIVSGWGRTV
jgi:hypothetical protein